MATAQGWRCPITGDMLTLSSPVDHCHKTGVNRGILSRRGNLLLGHAKDRIEDLERAGRYLKDRLQPTEILKCQADQPPHQPPA